jgi:hypothetical protein
VKKKKRKQKMTLAYSMELMRDEGFRVAKTERFNPFAKFRQDLYGFIDALAMDPEELVAVQSCTLSDFAGHLDKIAAHPDAFMWLSAPARRLELHGWGLQGPAKTRKLRVIRRLDVTKLILTQNLIEVFDEKKDRNPRRNDRPKGAQEAKRADQPLPRKTGTQRTQSPFPEAKQAG